MAELGCCRSDLLLVFGLCSARNWPDIPEPLPVAIAWDLGLNGGAARFPRGFPCSHGSTSRSLYASGVDLGTVVGRELHGCCALVSAGGCGDGGQVLTCSGNVHCMIAFCPKTERYK